MIPGICIAAGALIMVFLRRKQRSMPPDEIVRLSLYADKMRREESHSFE